MSEKKRSPLSRKAQRAGDAFAQSLALRKRPTLCLSCKKRRPLLYVGTRTGFGGDQQIWLCSSCAP